MSARTAAEATLSRLLRGMARRVWEMRRTVEHTHQLYAREVYARERADRATTACRAEAGEQRRHWRRQLDDIQEETRKQFAILLRQVEQAQLDKAGAEGERDAADDTLAWIRDAFGVEDAVGWGNELHSKVRVALAALDREQRR